MGEKKTSRLAGLVKEATNDLSSEKPLRRGRGLEGILSEGKAEPTDTPAPQGEKPGRPQADDAAGKSEEVVRTVKSYRIRDDIAYRIDVLAATERRKIYEVVEEALDLYLQTHTQIHVKKRSKRAK
jgi:hypothetical protein